MSSAIRSRRDRVTVADPIGQNKENVYRPPTATTMSSYEITDLLNLVTTENAESLSLHTGELPVVHLGGEPHPIEGPPITPENAQILFRSLATPQQVREFSEHRTADFIYIF